jgi:hypothetical protein
MMERRMKVFLSWSGDQSRAVAEALKGWLPLVLHYINPWVSSQDIKAGARWADAVTEELEGSNFGILCLTKDNQSAPWMLFEAGALSNAISAGAVCPYLLDIEIRDLTGPLSQFQAKKTNETSTRELLLAINNSASEPLPEQNLVEISDGLWPKLENKLAEIPEAKQRTEPQPRPESEILEELVQAVRAMDRRFEGLERTVEDPLVAEHVRLLENHFAKVYEQHSELVKVVSKLRALNFDDPDPATVQELNMAFTDLRLLVSSTGSDLLAMQERISELSGRSPRTISGS